MSKKSLFSSSYQDGSLLVPRQAPPKVGTTMRKAHVEHARPDSVATQDQFPWLPSAAPLVYTAINRLPPSAGRSFANHARRPGDTPVRISFIVNTFTFGGSETDIIELVYGADPRLLQFTGIAVATPLPIPVGEPRKDGSFPPIYASSNPYIDPDDPRVRIVSDFKKAVRIMVEGADIVISWGLADLHEHLPVGRLPKIVVPSKDSGEWARSFLYPNSMLTKYYVGNSTLAAAAFPEPLREQVRVIPNGINPERVTPLLKRNEQRRIWGLTGDDKIAGYLGRIERDKGVSKTVEGVARLPEEWKAVFIGVNPNSRYADELAQHCEQTIPGRYRLLEWCHDVGSALAAFDVFCHPSDHEGFSNSIGEAWLAGVPTVYTQDTGAIPDVGELGIGVSPDAGGAEIADALLKAYGNQELVGRAQSVIENGFLVKHMVQHWTDYLLEVHRQTEKPRVMLLFPADAIDTISIWLQVFALNEHDLDLCCLAIEGAPGPFYTLADAEIYRIYRCPTFHIGASSDTGKLIRYTRPDAIVTFQAPTLAQLLPAHCVVPVLVAPLASETNETSWVRWLDYLTSKTRDDVFKQDRA